MEALIQRTECATCREVRRERKRVLDLKVIGIAASGRSPVPSDIHAPPFTEAPALYSFNVPRYFNIQLRAQEFAKAKHAQLLWCHAVDVPLHPGDRDLPEEARSRKLASWLTRHDQDTNHLISILPLIKDLPLRLTDTIDRDLQLYKGRRCKMWGWTLHPHAMETKLEAGEIVLDKLPLVIYVYFPEAGWRIGKLPQGVYPMSPKTRTWKVNRYSGIEARRTSYPLILDFGGTAHMIQGASLDAAFWVSQDVTARSSSQCQIAGYTVLSRVKTQTGMYILQPFSKTLFTRGPPLGPDLLIRKLSGRLTVEKVIEEWRTASFTSGAGTEGKAKEEVDPMKQKYKCVSCYLSKKPYMHLPRTFGVTEPQHLQHVLLQQGCWTRCQACRRQHGLPAVVDPSEKEIAPSTDNSECKGEVCKQCSTAFPGLPLQVDAHVCYACKEICPANEWKPEILRAHGRKKIALVCAACKDKGCDAGRTELFYCQGCQERIWTQESQ